MADHNFPITINRREPGGDRKDSRPEQTMKKAIGTTATINSSPSATGAFPPLPRQPSMAEWLAGKQRGAGLFWRKAAN
jgi:hypothetical protein